MIRNYFKIAYRMMLKEKAITLVNILGMSLGIACCLLIFLWAEDELSFNHQSGVENNICYVYTNHPMSNGEIKTYATTPQPLKAVLEEKYPAIEKVALLSWGNTMEFKKEDKLLMQHGVDASPDIFDIFELQFLQGNHNSLFQNPLSIVISESFAESYYGKDWEKSEIIGLYLTNDKGDTFELAGVFFDLPKNSTLNFEFVIPYSNRLKNNPWLEHWGNFANQMYVKIADNISLKEANESVKNAIIDHRTDEATTEELILQPYTDQYLYNNFENGKIVGGRIEYVQLLSFAAILILLLASLNFINLTTARSAKRAKETGVRKVLGALKINLRFQFIIEAVLTTFISVCLSVFITILLLPQFNHLTGKSIDPNLFSPQLILYFLGFSLLLGFCSGIYPAFYLSALDPVKSIKGVFNHDRKEAFFRKSMIAFQFVITIIMIIGAISVYQQVKYIQDKNIGYNKENLVEVYMGDIDPVDDFGVFRHELLQKSGIKGVTAIHQNLLNIGNTTSDPEWKGKLEKEIISFNIMCSDPDFISTTQIHLKEGRNFDWNIPTDTSNFIINEAARKAMRMENPIGENLGFWDTNGQIIGVIDDVHFHSLHSAMEPLIIRYDPPMTNKMLVRIDANETKDALISLEKLYHKYNQGKTFGFNFLSEMYKNQYKSEYLVKDLVFYFTALAILISCLGLFSLIAYEVSHRIKEIGIRKVLGASIFNILQLISKNFIVLVSISFVIAAPIAYLLINNWLENFAYRTEIHWRIYVASGIMALIITILVISIQTIRSAKANPIETLRND